jgi:thiol-disulfide isomerase/thioredoxin
MRIALVMFIMLFTTSLLAQDIKSVKITELEKTIAESKTPLIINFWATFCIPCIEEIPYFQEEVKKHEKEGVQLLLVSLDLKSHYPQKVKAFTTKQKFTAPMVWLNETDADYFCPKIDPKWSGSIPASLFINNKTGYRKFIEAELTREELVKEIESLLGNKK